MREIKQQSELIELHSRGDGLVLNDFGSHAGARPGEWNVLHAASCAWVPRSKASIPKLAFEDFAEALAWLVEHRGAEAVAWKRCGACKPGHGLAHRQPPREKEASVEPPIRDPTGGDQFHIEATATEVEAWSDQRLPFEPTGWKKTFRDDLRTAVRTLSASPGEGVRAIFSSEDRELVDAENVLVYNLGASCFRANATASLAIERSFSAPWPDPEDRRWQQHHRYLVEPATAPHRCWTRATTLGRFRADDLGDLNESTKTSALWWAIKHGAIEPIAPLGRGELFGLEIELASSGQVNLASVVKPIVDAAVVAFEAHADPASAAQVAPLIARKIQVPAERIEGLLLDRSTAVLGLGSIVRPRQPSGQWNPADDRIAVMRIVHRATTTTTTLSGELFAVNAKGRSDP